MKTDEEIIKDWKECLSYAESHELNLMDSIPTLFIKETVEMLERQQAEIERYKDLEEQGRLIELPCAIGDTAYFVTANADGDYIIGRGNFSFSWIDYPRMVFATKEEAEAKFKELVGANNGR